MFEKKFNPHFVKEIPKISIESGPYIGTRLKSKKK